MEILITDSKTISEIQKEFNLQFPFLKLEFFDAPHKPNTALPKSKMHARDKKLGAIRRLHKEGKLKIAIKDTVNEVESGLWKNFGLSAQIFRRSGNLWIETSLTDNWTLEQQNREGYELSGSHKNLYKEADEKDLTDRDKWE